MKQNPKCARANCDRESVIRGYCKSHYTVAIRNGTIEKLPLVSKVCKYKNCNGINDGRSLCSKHRERERRGIFDPNWVGKQKGSTLLRDANGDKQCTKCKAWKPEAEFYAHTHTLDRLRTSCKDCYAPKDKDKYRQLYYGLSPEDVAVRLKAQGYACPCCGKELNETYFVVDHDNACCPRIKKRRTCGTCVRGLLCPNCNSALGMMADSADSLRRAADYLEKFNKQKIEREKLSA